MPLAGDELRRTQQGKYNTCCQDTPYRGATGSRGDPRTVTHLSCVQLV
jgi:hypothetical protein